MSPYRIYLVTDPALCTSISVEETVRAAIRGGATAIQLRDKDASDAELVELARRLLRLTRPLGLPLIVNDRIEVARQSGADGVHVGQSDHPPQDARDRLGPGAIIGYSVETLEQALAAEDLEVDYLGVGPIFATTTKLDAAPPWGLDALKQLRRQSRHTLVAIGGIHSGNAAHVRDAGADGLAIVSAICGQADPEKATRMLARIWDERPDHFKQGDST